MRSRLALAVVVVLTGVAGYAGNVLATPGSGFTAAQQWKGVFGAIDLKAETAGADVRPWQNLPGPTSKPKWFWAALQEYQRRRADGSELALRTKSTSDVYVTRNAIGVGGHSGWHTHPGPSLIIVTAGEIMAYNANDPTCTPTRYRAGEGFVDPGGGSVHLLRNESGAPAETVAVQILSKGAERRIDTPATGNCSF